MDPYATDFFFFAFDFQVKDYGEWTGKGENKSVAKFSCQRLLQSRYISFAIRTCIIRERDKGQNSWKILWAFTLGDFRVEMKETGLIRKDYFSPAFRNTKKLLSSWLCELCQVLYKISASQLRFLACLKGLKHNA